MRYGFVIDHNRCIGCHACTVACKEEHNVPVGVFRTWVKYIEKGEFPATSRHFGVMRCNHCDAAPCVEICPTSALFHRADGIVDFDNRRCIGCKSCMQACPYDALYIDPETQTAAKCNFCAHRIELDLEPACVIVCPTRAIIAGDLDDPQSNVSTIIATQKVAARKPHKSTEPKLFYAGIEGDFLQPSTMRPQASHLFAEHNPAANLDLLGMIGGADSAPGAARVVYDVAHPRPWGSIPAFYLWTKAIAAGVLMLATLLIALAATDVLVSRAALFTLAAPAVALVFVGLTALLLIADLKRPDRFYYILIKPNPRSWLVWGTLILMLYGALAAGWLVYGLLGTTPPEAFRIVAACFGAASAGYSAFLFAQAKGRDLWQSPLFLWILLAQAFVAGAATLLILALSFGSTALFAPLDRVLVVAVSINSLMILGQLAIPTYTAEARLALLTMRRGKLGVILWLGAILAGTIIPLVLLFVMSQNGISNNVMQISAAVFALIGLLCFDEVWIKAGQAPPLS